MVLLNGFDDGGSSFLTIVDLVQTMNLYRVVVCGVYNEEIPVRVFVPYISTNIMYRA